MKRILPLPSKLMYFLPMTAFSGVMTRVIKTEGHLQELAPTLYLGQQRWLFAAPTVEFATGRARARLAHVKPFAGAVEVIDRQWGAVQKLFDTRVAPNRKLCAQPPGECDRQFRVNPRSPTVTTASFQIPGIPGI